MRLTTDNHITSPPFPVIPSDHQNLGELEAYPALLWQDIRNSSVAATSSPDLALPSTLPTNCVGLPLTDEELSRTTAIAQLDSQIIGGFCFSNAHSLELFMRKMSIEARSCCNLCQDILGINRWVTGIHANGLSMSVRNESMFVALTQGQFPYLFMEMGSALKQAHQWSDLRYVRVLFQVRSGSDFSGKCGIVVLIWLLIGAQWSSTI